MERILKRKLEDRSYLKFEYYGPKNTVEHTLYIPFFENIQISESQSANYAVYDLLSRSGNLYAYMGAKSRNISLNFVMTFPHIKHYIASEGLEAVFGPKKSFDSQTSKREQFLRKINDRFDQASYHRNMYKSLTGVGAGLSPDALKQSNKAVDLYLYWINTIRTSVINHSTNLTQGPPIITLVHGSMYNHIPCVCTKYEVQILEESGFDLQTMTPRQVRILMDLEEVRVGDFSTYRTGSSSQRNNLAGWDSFIEFETMDPYEVSPFYSYESD